ncbi:MAG: histidine phosphatase family protein [Rhizobiaceae bacterium]|nr:MAG: histidine phosphatase family protein [Rhizobiaceae bacterium]CAG1004022.1 putative phosphoglycerate mutase [Rhizobiaceae bacterium]
MARLLLLRHAKAGWAEPGMRDFDRPLDRTGIEDAVAIGVAMGANDFRPDLVICSNARRARQTLDAIADHVELGRVLYTDGLYSTDASGYVDIVREAPLAESLLLVGHNPMMEDVAFALAGDGEDEAKSSMAAGFPTSGLAVIRFPGPLSDAAPGKGYLELFLTPLDT